MENEEGKLGISPNKWSRINFPKLGVENEEGKIGYSSRSKINKLILMGQKVETGQSNIILI